MKVTAPLLVLLGFIFAPIVGARPNVLVIMVDDLGYADLGVHGGREVRTPNIDALAAGGVRCTSGYVTAPYCSPSRAGLLTGRYQTRFGHEFNPHVGDEAVLGLPLDERTIADRLKSAGYATAVIGKWHQGFTKDRHPQSRGFDEFFGFLVGAHNYLLHAKAAPKFGTAHSHDLIYRGREVQKLEGHATDLFTDEAIRFMRRDPAKPWFLYLAYNAVHTPLEIAERWRERLPSSVTDPARRGYLALLLGLDEAIGRVTAHLRATGQERETLVFFLSDNGGAGRKGFFAYNTGLNTPLRGDKGQMLEGGIRVPFFVSWPGRLPAGATFGHPVSALDVLPTALAAAGRSRPEELDGADLLPFLTGSGKQAPHAALFWRFGPQRAVRRGNWKLVDWRDFEAKTNSGWQLFDLAGDIGETTDLAGRHPEIVAALSAEWSRWNASNREPLWSGTPNEDPVGERARAPTPKKAKNR